MHPGHDSSGGNDCPTHRSFFAVMSVMWKDGLLTGSGLTTSTSQLLPAAEEGGVWVIRWSLSL
jgi:hypothetical protein